MYTHVMYIHIICCNIVLFCLICSGLFNRAILQSGTAISSWALASDHRSVSYEIARKLNCHTRADEEQAENCVQLKNNTEEHNACLVNQLPSESVLQCLKEAPLDKVVESSLWFVVSMR